MAVDALGELCSAVFPSASLIVVPFAKLKNTMTRSVLKCFKTTPGMIVSVNIPAKSLEQQFQLAGVATDKIFFVDFVSGQPSLAREKNILHLSRPSDLTSLSIAISQFLEAIEGKKFLIIDTVNTFLIYNTSNMLASFIHSLSEKAHRHELKLCVFATPESELLNKIAPFFDNVFGLGREVAEVNA
ncbi:MAG: hypothetical protein V1839_00050 [archaeon]